MRANFFSSILFFIFVLAGTIAGDDNSDSSSNNTDTSHNIKLGFGLTAMGAGAAVLGSLIPFLDLLFPYIPGYENFRITQSKGFLAGSLSFSAGVLTFLTISDLYSTATSEFNTSNINQNYSTLVVTAIFTGTIVLLILGKKFLIKMGFYHHHHKSGTDAGADADANANEEIEIGKREKGDVTEGTQEMVKPRDIHLLKVLGFQVAVALAVHNIPEGFANFVTIVTNPQVGILFAIALALHKIPEGLIISLPIYYATGSRMIAFSVAGITSVTAYFVGALIGYALTENAWNGVIPGVIFSVVVGFLLYVIFSGMFPLARHYDPTDKYCTYFTCGGFFFVSLVESLLSISGVDA